MDYIIKLINKRKVRWSWLWKMAWKDARYNLGRLLLFITSIVIGVAALVAINGFNSNLKSDIDDQSKELLGADLKIESDNKPFNDSTLASLDQMAVDKAKDARFASMVYFPENGGSRLIQAIALSGDFPFYGDIITTPESDESLFRAGKAAMIDEPLARQFNVEIGDSLSLGKAQFYISAIVTRFPGNNNIAASFAPGVYFPYSSLEATELVQYGSRVEYNTYYKVEEGEMESILAQAEQIEDKHGYDVETVASTKEDLSEGFQNLYKFFKLLSFVALILGCIGVASSVHIYIREKRIIAAALRCMGTSGWAVFRIFLVQIIALGMIGSIVGIGVGIAIQYLLPAILTDFLPVDVTVRFVPAAALEGLATGLIITILFSVLPLNSMRFVAPLEILRSAEIKRFYGSRLQYVMIALIILFPWLFALYQTEDLLESSAFFGGLSGAFLVLFGLSRALIMAVRKLFPRKSHFIWKQSFANLFRPNNQTTVLVIVIGLGVFLIASLSLVQKGLLNQVEFSDSGDRSNTVLFDIQPYQKEDILNMTKQYDLDVKQVVPIVTMRIESIKGRPVDEWQNDTTVNMSNNAMTREYRVTYRDTLISSEKISKGTLIDSVARDDSVFISVADWVMDRLKLELKDEIVFNVQGLPVKTYIGSIREIDWRRVQTNFSVLFPEGVLEQAPKFYVLVTRIDDPVTSASFQKQLVQHHPNVSMIDLTLIINTLDDIFDKVAFVIRFMVLFSILTGMVVLIGAVINSKFARLKENVLLRTLGAVRKQIVGMTLLEYTWLGLFAGLTGILLALGASWALSVFFFDIAFYPDIKPLMVIWGVITVLTVLIGWYNTRSVLKETPMEILRKVP